MIPIHQRKLLLFIPVTVYLLSYIYLAIYHGEAWLFDTVIHEGGKYSLLETTFYASHFIGHIPVYIFLSLYFTGVYLLLSETKPITTPGSKLVFLASALVLLLAFSVYISLNWFGYEETMNYILQRKQSVVRYEAGGSWNLHLPSTLMQFLLIPVFIIVAKWVFGSRLTAGKKGITFTILALAGTHLFTVFLNDSAFAAYELIWTDPRYLAHSVRELATFPLTYYTIPLYVFLMHSENRGTNRHSAPRSVVIAAWGIGVIFLALFAYQCIVPLQVGIGDLAQKPDFAKGGELPIIYLLASHYFEHFLDTLFFMLSSLILFYSYIRIRDLY